MCNLLLCREIVVDAITNIESGKYNVCSVELEQNKGVSVFSHRRYAILFAFWYIGVQ